MPSTLQLDIRSRHLVEQRHRLLADYANDGVLPQGRFHVLVHGSCGT